MMYHLKYLWYVLRHKWFVFVAGLRTGAPLWNLLVHDWSKFSRAEWSAYVWKFMVPLPSALKWQDWVIEEYKRGVDADFAKAWEHHWIHNPHHWEYWVNPLTDYAKEMPEPYVREMVADWIGAGRAITGSWDDVHSWYEKNKTRMKLHPETRIRVEAILFCLNLDY